MTRQVSLKASYVNGNVMGNGRMACYCPQLDVYLRYLPGEYGTVKGVALTVGLRGARPLHDVVSATFPFGKSNGGAEPGPSGPGTPGLGSFLLRRF
jgi:hypothetical protein